MTIDQNRLETALRDSVTQGVSLDLRFKAVRKEFEAAGVIGDNPGMDKARAQLHDLLDADLDNQASLMSLARTLAAG